MSLPAPLPLIDWSDETWSSCVTAWQACADLETAQRLTKRRRLLHPYLRDCQRSLGSRFALVLEESSLLMDAMLFLDGREGLPVAPLHAQILMESLLLRLVKAGDEYSLSKADPMRPWQQVRSRVNSERRSYRRYFLAFLPRIPEATELEPVVDRVPGKAWIQLWDRVVGDTPQGCIPRAWREVHQTALNSVEQLEKKNVFSTNLILPTQSNWKEYLGEALHRAGALVESRRPGLVGLHLPEGVIPSNPRGFAREIISMIQRSGGAPQSDPLLAKALEEIQSWDGQSAGGAKQLPAEQFLQVGQDLGFDAFKSLALRSMVYARAGDFGEARRVLEMNLTHCTSRHQIAMTLGNIGGVLLSKGDWDEASRYLKDALTYSASSFIVRHNYRLLLECLEKPHDGEESQHA